MLERLVEPEREPEPAQAGRLRFAHRRVDRVLRPPCGRLAPPRIDELELALSRSASARRT